MNPVDRRLLSVEKDLIKTIVVPVAGRVSGMLWLGIFDTWRDAISDEVEAA